MFGTPEGQAHFTTPLFNIFIFSIKSAKFLDTHIQYTHHNVNKYNAQKTVLHVYKSKGTLSGQAKKGETLSVAINTA